MYSDINVSPGSCVNYKRESYSLIYVLGTAKVLNPTQHYVQGFRQYPRNGEFFLRWATAQSPGLSWYANTSYIPIPVYIPRIWSVDTIDKAHNATYPLGNSRTMACIHAFGIDKETPHLHRGQYTPLKEATVNECPPSNLYQDFLPLCGLANILRTALLPLLSYEVCVYNE
jgi:hypothetical protein